MNPQQFLFGSRMSEAEAISLTISSMNEYGPRHNHWVIAWPGGKDSTATLTLILNLLDAGLIAPPRSLTVCYADTRMEIPPLWISARKIMQQLDCRGIEVIEAVAKMEKRFLPYMLGRGVPPPSNTFRWCTGHIKVEPMEQAVEGIFRKTGEKLLVITGVRQGESAVRDGRISMSCSKNGAECGQGWYQTGLDGDIASTLAPILHWRLCHVWDWLKVFAPSKSRTLIPEYPGLSGGAWDTAVLADAYGGEQAEEVNARTGCMGCPLASKDKALEAVVKMDDWKYLAPLLGLKPLYREMKLARHRLRKPGGEKRKDGTLSKNQNRMGPLTLKARQYFLNEFLRIQNEVNWQADQQGRPRVDFLNDQEVALIVRMRNEGVWPDGWSGSEPVADQLMHSSYHDGSVLLNLFVSPTPIHTP